MSTREDWLRTAPDGHTVFYPWGNICKQGYVVPDADLKRVRRQINLWITVSLVLFGIAWRGVGFS